jgi:hypothetical protein
MEHPIGNSKGNSINGKHKKDQRRQESYARLEIFNALSLEEKLKQLPSPGANRQRARLEAQLAARKDNQAEKQRVKEERTQKAAEQLVDQQQHPKKKKKVS